MIGPGSGGIFRVVAAVVAAVVLTQPARAQERGPVAVEPGDLTRRPELVGREVVVDDRVARFQVHPERGFDQIFLRRAPDFPFDLPVRLRPAENPAVAAVTIRGILRHEAGRWWCDVTRYDPQPADLDRLNRAVAALARTDVAARTAWSRWAERRGTAFKDEALQRRGREIEAATIRIEGERPPRENPSGHWLALAERARAARVPEPEPSAQAHQGFRAALAAARSAADRKALVARIERFFPGARTVSAAPEDLSRWESAYQHAPADAYRSAPPEARAALDRKLLADALELSLEDQGRDDPRSLIGLADEAARVLPDRPAVAGRFLERGLAWAASDLGALRRADVDRLAGLYRDALRRPESARALHRAWLDDQKDHRLSPRDADGRIALAAQYETLLNDRATADALLRAALAIDPRSAEVAEAFQRRGYRKVDGDWVQTAKAGATVPGPDDPGPLAATAAAPPDRAVAAPAENPGARSDALRGSTPEEVRSRLGGRPNRKLWVATQGQVVEQWIYFGARENQYITFVHRPGESRPRVISFHVLPRGPGDPSASP